MVDNTVCRQKADGNPEEVLKLRAYMKELGSQMEEPGRRSPTRTIIDYTLEKVNEAKSLIDDSKKDVKQEKPDQNQLLPFCCQFCREPFPGPIPLHQHERYLCKMNEEIQAVLQPDAAAGRRGGAASEPPGADRAASPVNAFKEHVSVLQTYFTMNTEPNSEELLKISVAVGLPQEFVKEWFSQWRGRSQEPDRRGAEPEAHAGFSNGDGHRLLKARGVRDGAEQLRGDTPSPLNLSSSSSKASRSSCYTPNSLASEEPHAADSPLDLSLPKHVAQRLLAAGHSLGQNLGQNLSQNLKRPRPNGLVAELRAEAAGRVSLELMDMKKDVLGSDSLRPLEKSASPVFGINPFAGAPVYSSLPHGAFPPPPFMSPAQASLPGLRPYAGIDPIGFLPHMAFSYSDASFAELQHRRKIHRKPGFQVTSVCQGMQPIRG